MGTWSAPKPTCITSLGVSRLNLLGETPSLHLTVADNGGRRLKDLHLGSNHPMNCHLLSLFNRRDPPPLVALLGLWKTQHGWLFRVPVAAVALLYASWSPIAQFLYGAEIVLSVDLQDKRLPLQSSTSPSTAYTALTIRKPPLGITFCPYVLQRHILPILDGTRSGDLSFVY